MDEEFYVLFEAHKALLDPIWTHIPKFIPVRPLILACDATPKKVAFFTIVDGKHFSASEDTIIIPIAANEGNTTAFGVRSLLKPQHDAIIVAS